MQSLKDKREALVRDLRQKNREKIRQELRDKLTNSLAIQERPLISTTLSLFWDLSHFELAHTSETIT